MMRIANFWYGGKPSVAQPTPLSLSVNFSSGFAPANAPPASLLFSPLSFQLGVHPRKSHGFCHEEGLARGTGVCPRQGLAVCRRLVGREAVRRRRRKKFTAIENFKIYKAVQSAPRRTGLSSSRARLSSPSPSPTSTPPIFKMADEVYDGAIGIDLGNAPCLPRSVVCSSEFCSPCIDFSC